MSNAGASEAYRVGFPAFRGGTSITQQIPDRGQHLVCYYGHYANPT